MPRGRPKGHENKKKKEKIPYKEQKKIVEMYCGVMNEQEIHEEFGIAPSMQRKIIGVLERESTGQNTRQLCWNCRKATNMFLCRFVRSCSGSELKYYDGTKFSENGMIISCPQFIKG